MANEVNADHVKATEKRVRKAVLTGFVAGATIGGVVVACVKDDSDSIREIGKVITTVATSWSGYWLVRSIFG